MLYQQALSKGTQVSYTLSVLIVFCCYSKFLILFYYLLLLFAIVSFLIILCCFYVGVIDSTACAKHEITI